MKEKPLVTICIPVYNGEKFIRDALDSALFQTYENFEILISDDSSTDATERICKEYSNKDTRIKIFRHAKILELIKTITS